MEKRVVVRLTVEGLHCWPDCDIKEVSYLKDLHRHTFYIEMQWEVTHNNRDIEIIQRKRQVKDWLHEVWHDDKWLCHNFTSMSCEDIAEMLMKKFDANFVSVLEDNENGAICRR